MKKLIEYYKREIDSCNKHLLKFDKEPLRVDLSEIKKERAIYRHFISQLEKATPTDEQIEESAMKYSRQDHGYFPSLEKAFLAGVEFAFKK